MGLTVSGNTKMIERAIDRFIKMKDQPNDDQPKDVQANDDQPNDVQPNETDELDPANETQSFIEPSEILEPQLTMQVTGKGIEVLTQTNYDAGLKRLHRIAWSNLPILNYLHIRYPDKDPLAVYKTLFGQQLVEPTGGQYVWDAEVQSYVSTHHGFELKPKAGPTMSPAIGPKDQIQTAISFQDGGLRATLSVTDNPN